MNYLKAFIMKYVLTTGILWIVLGVFFGAGFGSLLLLSFLITVVGFLFGDLFMLPRFENWGATITDFLLVFAGVWLFSTYYTAIAVPAISAAAITAIVISICEVFFHKYVDSHIIHSDDRTGGREKSDLSPDERLQTEFGEEIEPVDEEE